MTQNGFHLFDAFGVELEYMLVDAETLDVRPQADQVLARLAGKTSCDAELGPVTWSNELALHVLELKCTEPARTLYSLASSFRTAIDDLSGLLHQQGLRLLPTAVHPWMDPAKEARLWPHEYHEIYETYDRIFNCRTHGWANVQSVHLNLPFADDAEFAQLHAAVRLVLPLLPALAASSPILDAAYSEYLDKRMDLYASHCHAVPSLIGDLVPEAVFSEQEYRQAIMNPIVQSIAPLDPAGVMLPDFLNARGAIARFDRKSIEIRVMDVQEYPQADLAICAAAISLLKALCAANWSSLESQQSMSTQELKEILLQTARSGEAAVINNTSFLAHYGIEESSISAGDMWRELLEGLQKHDPELNQQWQPLQIILENGCLATRIKSALGDRFDRRKLAEVYHQLADCLSHWRPFVP